MTESGPEPAIWGIHNDTLTSELVDGSFISLGWDELGALDRIPEGRDGLKAVLAEARPEDSTNSIAGQAGVLFRFRSVMREGDVVVAPYKPDSTVNIGVITGDYYYDGAADQHRHRRPVRWEKIGLSRTVFTQPALYELGAFITVFRIRRHAAEFLAALRTPEQDVDKVTVVVEDAVPASPDADVDETVDEPRASRIERHTRDFILEVLHTGISHQAFEEFTAALLQSVGYQARVTRYSQDGGVDVLAHRDQLGIEPPLIKVQCKHTTATIGAPAVHQLVGTQGTDELSIFVTLGTYSRDAIAIERQRSGIRLLTGEDVVSLVVDNYSRLPERWRSLIPLTPVLAVSDSASG